MAATEPAVCTKLVPTENPRTPTNSFDPASLTIRSASVADARRIWQLVDESTVLDSNSCYCYLLLCRDFFDTCLVACCKDDIVGFVTAYCPPHQPDCVFVWQVGVAPQARRQGLAGRMLRSLIALPACAEVHYLEATVTPSNTASRRLFQSLADHLRVPCQVSQGFTADLFGGGNHEQEELFRIGPFPDPPKEK